MYMPFSIHCLLVELRKFSSQVTETTSCSCSNEGGNNTKAAMPAEETVVSGDIPVGHTVLCTELCLTHFE